MESVCEIISVYFDKALNLWNVTLASHRPPPSDKFQTQIQFQIPKQPMAAFSLTEDSVGECVKVVFQPRPATGFKIDQKEAALHMTMRGIDSSGNASDGFVYVGRTHGPSVSVFSQVELPSIRDSSLWILSICLERE